MKKTYYEKLRDPLWQRKRLEVMEANNFSCELCGASELPLNVHHKEYFKGAEPWEYEIKQLACLCEVCHEASHEGFDVLKWVCSQAPLDGPHNRIELALLIAGFTGIKYEDLLDISGMPGSSHYKFVHTMGLNNMKQYWPDLIDQNSEFKNG